MRPQRHNGLCGSDCPYRRLYEGSQASLADMAGKQADALNRVARLRTGIVTNLKQTFPVEFGTAEAQLSKRMSSTDDEVLLAYLSGFLAMPARPSAAQPVEPAGLSDLREELEALGVTVPAGADLAQWAASVAAFAQAAAARAAQAAPDPQNQPTDPAAVPGPAKAAAPTTGQRRRTGARSLLDGAASTGYAADHGSSTVPTADALDPASDPGYLDAPATDDVVPADEWADADVPWSAEPPADEYGTFADEVADLDVPAARADASGSATAEHSLDDLFGTDDDGRDLSSLFTDDEDSDPAANLVDALFHAEPGSESGADPSREGASDGADSHDPRAGGGDGPTPQTSNQAPLDQAAPAERDQAGSVTFPAPPTTAGLAAQSATTPKPAKSPTAQSSTTAGGGGRGGGAALRPELFPSAQLPKGGKSARRTAKTSRVSAAPPDPRGLDVPIAEGATGADLTDEMFSKLVASVVIPRPVFLSDLVAQVGSAELVSAWEQRCRDLGTDSPVRFITPKPRHRDRGALIVPHSPELRKAASEFTRSWWATCLDERRLRGAKLYEVAVLLHRFGASVISSRIEGDVVVLRVNQARGLVGVAVALETDFAPGGSTRTQLADAVGELLADRLTLVAVLTYSSGGGTLEKLAATIREESDARGWRPTTPVIASLSWDFAADGGSSALSVL